MRGKSLWTVVLLAGTAAAQEAAPPGAEAAAQQPAAPAEAQQAPAEAARRVLRGRVLDATTGEGVPLATVTVDAKPPIAVEADVEGNFVVEGVPAGALTVRGFSADYLPLDVRITADQEEVTLKLAQNFTEEVVVVGRATEISRVNAANAVAQVKGEDLHRTPVQTVDAALQGKVAGANIQSNSGAPGGGLQLRLRGVSTINGQSNPLYVVDGVLLSDIAISNGINAVSRSAAGSSGSSQDDSVNRIADINPADIEDIQILKGASAAAIYGSKASNGVVIITTKRGKATSTQPQVDFAQRVGISTPMRKLGSRTWTEEEAVAAFSKKFASQGGADKVRELYGSGQVFDHEGEIMNNAAPARETNLSVAGSLNNGTTTYFLSGLLKDDEGIVKNTGYEKQSLRLNLGQRFSDRFQVNVATNLVHSLAQRGLFNNDNNNVSHYMVLSSTPSFLDLRPDENGVYPANPFISQGTNPLQTVELMQNDEDVWRFLGAADASWSIVKDNGHDLRLMGNLGVDRFQQKNILFFPPELIFEPRDDGLAGTSLDTNSDNTNVNVGLNMVHTWTPTGGVVDSATTSVGFQYEERARSSLYVTSRNQVGSQQNVDNGTALGVDQVRERQRDRGVYVQEEMLLANRRLTLSAAVRGETSSLNGNPNQLFFYPKAAVAYRIPGLPQWMNELKVRGAYGEAGNLPNWGYKFTPLGIATTDGLPGIVGLANQGNSNIIPERQREFELGTDIVAFNGDGLFEFTVYQRNISDMLLQRNVAPSSGFAAEFFNGGGMVNRGVELTLQATPVRNDLLKWESRTTFTLNRSEVTDLPVPAYYTGGFGTAYGTYRIEQGKSLTAIYGNVGLDENGRPIAQAIGDAEPTFRMGFANTLQVGNLRVYAMLDWLRGAEIINLTRILYEGSANSAGYNEVTADRAANSDVNTRPYIEDGSFLKLREVTVSYDLPANWYQQAIPGLRSARLALSGRNLLMFTNYTGLDPEVSNFGNQAVARNIDVAPFPPSRSFWGSIELGF